MIIRFKVSLITTSHRIGVLTVGLGELDVDLSVTKVINVIGLQRMVFLGYEI